jgi:deoxyribodipyrimidine photo-lyase
VMNWQWVAGSGADASPWFRIFNPIAQGERYDPEGDYVRQWIPELAKLPAKHIHAPWTAPDALLKEAGVILGDTYPRPIVEHEVARKRALEVLKTTRAND